MTGVSTTRSIKRCAMVSARVLGLLWLLSAASAGAEVRVLADPAQMLATARRVGFSGQHNYGIEQGPRGPVLRSTAQSSASGLYQDVQIDGRSLRKVRWTWRVDALPWSADLRNLEREDVGAAVFFVFGEPSFLNSDVPTLAYVWSSTPVADGTGLPSLRFHSLRYIQLRGGGMLKPGMPSVAILRRITGRPSARILPACAMSPFSMTTIRPARRHRRFSGLSKLYRRRRQTAAA